MMSEMAANPTFDHSSPTEENVPDGPSDPLDARPSKKKVNPLVDLIDTEKIYVELLAVIIRRVASAWSRSNFPPRQLDSMFRAVETVYRTNKGLLSVGFQICSTIILLSPLSRSIETKGNWAEPKLP